MAGGAGSASYRTDVTSDNPRGVAPGPSRGPGPTEEPSSGKFYGNSFTEAVADGRWQDWLDRYDIKIGDPQEKALREMFDEARIAIQEGASYSHDAFDITGGTDVNKISNALRRLWAQENGMVDSEKPEALEAKNFTNVDGNMPGVTDWFETYFYEYSDLHPNWKYKQSLFTVLDGEEAVSFGQTDDSREWARLLGWQGHENTWESAWQRAHRLGTVKTDEEVQEINERKEIEEVEALQKSEIKTIRELEKLEKEVEALELEREEEKERFLPETEGPGSGRQRALERREKERDYRYLDEVSTPIEPPAPTFGDPGTTPPVPDEQDYLVGSAGADRVTFDDPHGEFSEDIPAVMPDDYDAHSEPSEDILAVMPDDAEHAEPASTDLTSAPTPAPTPTPTPAPAPKKKISEMTKEEREDYLEELKIRERVAKAKREELQNRKVEAKLGEDKRRADEDALIAQAKRLALERKEADVRRREEIDFQKEEEEDAIVKAGYKSERVRDENGRIVYSQENKDHNDRRRRIIAKRQAIRGIKAREKAFSDPTKRDRLGDGVPRTYAEEVQKQIADEDARVAEAQADAGGITAAMERQKASADERFNAYNEWFHAMKDLVKPGGTTSTQTFRDPASGEPEYRPEALHIEHKAILDKVDRDKSARPYIEKYKAALAESLENARIGPKKDRKILTDENGNSISVPNVEKYEYSLEDLSPEDRNLLLNYDPEGYDRARLNTEVDRVEGVRRRYEPSFTQLSEREGALSQIREDEAADRDAARRAAMEDRLARTLAEDPEPSLTTPAPLSDPDQTMEDRLRRTLDPSSPEEETGAQGPAGPAGPPAAPPAAPPATPEETVNIESLFGPDAGQPTGYPETSTPIEQADDVYGYREIPEGMVDTGTGFFDPKTHKIYDRETGNYIRTLSDEEITRHSDVFFPPLDSPRRAQTPVVNVAGQPVYREEMFEPHVPTLSQPFAPMPALTMSPQEPEQPSLGVLGSMDPEFSGPLETSPYVPEQPDLESTRLQSDFKNLYGTDQEAETQRRTNELIRANVSDDAMDLWRQRNPRKSLPSRAFMERRLDEPPYPDWTKNNPRYKSFRTPVVGTGTFG